MFLRTVGILDGPNGKGTGFFLSTDGMIATTRYVASGKENITVSLDGTRQMIGRVVRSYPELDLALIKLDLEISHLLPFSTLPAVPENMELTAVVHNGEMLRGRCRPTKREIKAHWFPTTFRQIGDVGGSPVYASASAGPTAFGLGFAARSNAGTVEENGAKVFSFDIGTANSLSFTTLQQ